MVATQSDAVATVEDYKAHEARVSASPRLYAGRWPSTRQFTEQQRFLTQAEMVEEIRRLSAGTGEYVADRKTLQPGDDTRHELPAEFPLPEGVTIETHLHNEVMAGLEKAPGSALP